MLFKHYKNITSCLKESKASSIKNPFLVNHPSSISKGENHLTQSTKFIKQVTKHDQVTMLENLDKVSQEQKAMIRHAQAVSTLFRVEENRPKVTSQIHTRIVISSYVKADVLATVTMLQKFIEKFCLFFLTRWKHFHGEKKHKFLAEQTKDLNLAILKLNQKRSQLRSSTSQKTWHDHKFVFQGISSSGFVIAPRFLLLALRNIAQTQLQDDGRLLPQSTKLHTVIRSPHVFKKTREQFGLTKTKYQSEFVIGLSKPMLQMVLKSAMLLKLPAEVKIITK